MEEDEVKFLPLSVLHAEYEVPKADSNRLYMIAGKEGDPFVKFEEELGKFLNGSTVRLIGFTIVD